MPLRHLTPCAATAPEASALDSDGLELRRHMGGGLGNGPRFCCCGWFARRRLGSGLPPSVREASHCVIDIARRSPFAPPALPAADALCGRPFGEGRGRLLGRAWAVVPVGVVGRLDSAVAGRTAPSSRGLPRVRPRGDAGPPRAGLPARGLRPEGLAAGLLASAASLPPPLASLLPALSRRGAAAGRPLAEDASEGAAAGGACGGLLLGAAACCGSRAGTWPSVAPITPTCAG